MSESPRILLMLRRLRADPGHVNEDEVLGRCERAALATALQLRAELDGSVTAIAVGPRREDRVLAMALRAGCDHAVRAHDSVLDKVDYLATAQVLAATATHVGFDLIICGDRSQDELHGATGPAVAELLGLPNVGSVVETRADAATVIVSQRAATKLHQLRCNLPCLLCVAAFTKTSSDENPSTSPRGGNIEQLYLADLGIDARELSHRRQFLGSARAVRPGCNATMLNSASELVARLTDDHLLG